MNFDREITFLTLARGSRWPAQTSPGPPIVEPFQVQGRSRSAVRLRSRYDVIETERSLVFSSFSSECDGGVVRSDEGFLSHIGADRLRLWHNSEARHRHSTHRRGSDCLEQCCLFIVVRVSHVFLGPTGAEYNWRC